MWCYWVTKIEYQLVWRYHWRVFYQGFTLTRQSIARTIESGHKERSPTWWQVVCWSNASILHHTSWCQLEFPLRERGGSATLRRRKGKDQRRLTICCRSWWNILISCWETLLIPAGWCTGTWGDENARAAWRTLPGLHWQGFVAARQPGFKSAGLLCVRNNARGI